MKQWRDQGVEMKFCAIGQKAVQLFRRLGGGMIAQASHLGDAPKIIDLIGTVKVMLDQYDSGGIDRLYLVYNRFVNTMSQKPIVEQLLPVHAEHVDEEMKHHWDYLYEPEAKEVIDGLLMRYIESLVYQGVSENIACEMAARMVAMKSASENAGSLISDLQLAYNKARQAAITQEISEIVSGAAAV
jgi:F-type H+-transporting ATPase subunit gamma